METKATSRYRFDRKDHVHLLDGKPLTGTSSVSSILSKPLSYWASGLAVMELGISDPKVLTKIKHGTATEEEKRLLDEVATTMHLKIQNMTIPEYIKLLDKAYRAHATTLTKKADEGTDLHAELERYVKDRIEGITEPIKKYHKRIQPFIDWAEANVDHFIWSEANCYSEKYWLGGITDCGLVDKQGRTAILDFKSSKAAYLSQFWQCAGYDIQISENGGFTEDGVNLFTLEKPIDYYIIFPFGMENPAPSMNFDTVGCKEAFLAEVTLYRKMPQDAS